ALALEKPSAEPARAAGLADGNHQSAAEPIVEPLLLLARDAEPCLLDELRVDLAARERLGQRVPQLGRVAETPRLRRFHGDAALLQMVACDGAPRMLPQDALVEAAGLLVGLGRPP